MLLGSNLGREFYDEMRLHYGHKIHIAIYGPPEEPENVAVECDTCNMVLMDADRPIRTILTEDGVLKVIAESWEDSDEQNSYPTAIQVEGGDWYPDDEIAFYSLSDEPVEDEFIEAFGEEKGKARYKKYLGEEV